MLPSCPFRCAAVCFVCCLCSNERYLPSTDDALLAAFRVIDEDGKGWISVNEISELLSKKGTAFRGQELAEFVQRARDPAQPNKIYYEDYVTAFTKCVDEIMSEADNTVVPNRNKKGAGLLLSLIHI